MKSKTKPKLDDLVKSIGELVKTRNRLARRAEQQYTFEVEAILSKQVHNSIEFGGIDERGGGKGFTLNIKPGGGCLEGLGYLAQ